MSANQLTTRITPAAALILAIHAFVAWVLCGAIVIVGRQIWSIETTLIVHALGVPIVFVVVSWIYFTYFRFTTPIQTAAIFTLSAITLDAVIVATFIEGSFEMFTSFIGTWLPFGLMFLTTYLVGTAVLNRQK